MLKLNAYRTWNVEYGDDFRFLMKTKPNIVFVYLPANGEMNIQTYCEAVTMATLYYLTQKHDPLVFNLPLFIGTKVLSKTRIFIFFEH